MHVADDSVIVKFVNVVGRQAYLRRNIGTSPKVLIGVICAIILFLESRHIASARHFVAVKVIVFIR